MTDLAAKGPAPGMPKIVLIFAALLVAITVVGAWSARVSGVGRSEAPTATVVRTLALRFDDQPDGSVLVRRASDGAAIYRAAPGTNGFMRATMRGLAHARRQNGVGDETPFVLTAWSDGRTSLEDATTGRRLALEAFGATNAAAFAQLFQASGAVR
ncbi:putative photosynthetic complex assembly protein [Roseiarcus fermentans]|uniref:Putative photosynthetic complex assembly protein n=1 Tax=Roseiarcus fermentans TaxID=1473586 RepID=A0A366FC55_9HYPH|nr:photosynthetic complex assembly protein PuhC [Roseiarcus fermentans]RBP11339.1 putative photosynthetic complex assembly protein [Roseiarcus fermentans]